MRKQKMTVSADTGNRRHELREKFRPHCTDSTADLLVGATACSIEKRAACGALDAMENVAVALVPGSLRQSDSTKRIQRTVRRSQLREIVPLADTTIYEMEQRGEFPRRFYLTPRCVVWDLGEVEAWVVERRKASDEAKALRAPVPDVRRRRTRPVKR
jgi:prophage regulatory protein